MRRDQALEKMMVKRLAVVQEDKNIPAPYPLSRHWRVINWRYFFGNCYLYAFALWCSVQKNFKK